MKLPSNSQKHFAEVPRANIERSAFDRLCTHKTMFNPDHLIPFWIDEVLPGDTYNVDVVNFIRMTSALKVPIMDNIYLDTFFFFVPNRLLWTNWKKFMGEQANPGDSVSFTKPQVVADATTGFVAGSLSDYFGLPLGVDALSVDAQFHRAYNLIYREWFRDQNLQNSPVVDIDDGPDVITDYVLLKRGKRHDYFTSCLPWAQKGTAVSIPMTGSAPVIGIGKKNQVYGDAGLDFYETGSAGVVDYPFSQQIDTGTDNKNFAIRGSAATGGFPMVYADLSSVSATTINALRLAFQTQKMLERDARGGTRYYELVKSHFNVIDPGNAVMQRPEFLGGRSTPIQITAVPQTSASDAQPTPLGAQAAYALGTNVRDGFTKSFTEHGVLMGLCMVRADLNYQQGLHKMFTRSTRLDYYWPALSHIGEQAVLSKEIYCDGAAGDADVFGYQERFAEYRYGRSIITCMLRSTEAASLDLWHLAQEFGSRPTLSSTFIEETMPIDRVIAVTDEPSFVMDSQMKCKTVRPMPTYSVPGLIDHF